MTPTIITSVKGRLAHLKESLPTWLAHTPLNVVVVDFDCPDDTHGWVLGQKNPRVHGTLQITGSSCFNKPLALNLGALYGDEGLLFLDADTRVTPEFWPWLAPRLETRGRFYVVEPGPAHRDLTGVLCVRRESFNRVEGYDEGMVGWGSEDLDLRLRLYLKLGLQPEFLPGELLQPIAHDDALRTRFYSEPDKQASQQRNLQRLVDNAERLTGRSIFALLEDPVVHRLFHVPT